MTTSPNPTSVSKFELYDRGMQALRNSLGTVDAEEFISLIKSDRFDYTKWQRRHFDAKSPEQISAEAEEYIAEHPYIGDPSTII